MLTLRLRRDGTKKRPVYHLVATDSRSRRDGRFVENLGFFIPSKDVIALKQDRVAYWLGVGAQVSSVAHHLIQKSKKQPLLAGPPAPNPSRRARAGRGGRDHAAKPAVAAEADGQARAHAEASGT